MIAKRWRAIAGVGLTMVMVGCSSKNGSPSGATLPKGTVTITTASGSRVQLEVQIAETDRARERGLMGVRTLAPDDGMAFVFDGPTTGSFWMKDTLIPLSIAFWDASGRIVGVLEMTPCRHDPCPLYSPGTAYVGAVEANRGFFSSHDVSAGDSLKLVRSEPAVSYGAHP